MGIESRRAAWAAGGSAVCAALCLLLLPLVGSADISYTRAWAAQSPDYEILFQVRLPRVLLAMITGGALAIAGVLFQALLRDALATPYTLGVSAGASLGAVAAISFGLPLVWPASLVGAAVTLLVVLAAGAKGRKLSSFTLLMAGVTVNSICLALILALHSVANFSQSFAIGRWLMGGIDPAPYSNLGLLGLVVVAIGLLVFREARHWNLLAVGEQWAAIRGVSTSRLILLGYVWASVLTAVVTAFTGPIGFIGLIVPHALRLGFGADHRLLLPASFFGGAAFLAICDTVGRTAMPPAEIPVGVITALLGGPFFIWLLRTR